MNHTIKKLPKSSLEISLTITAEELEKFVPTAIEELSKEVKIEGFRPGKVPKEILAQNLGGEIKIYERAAEKAIWQFYAEILNKESISEIGSPHFNILKIAPKNPVEVKITVPVLPEVIKLADWKKIKIPAKKVEVADEEIDKTIREVQKMQTVEKMVNREAKKEDKILIDMDMSLDGVPLEGGQAKNHAVYLNEPYYIPGLVEKLIGAKKDEAREFKLSFPKEHYQKNIAGKDVDFKIKTLDVFELAAPEIDDEFAQKLGQKSLAELKQLLKDNMAAEAGAKEKERQEMAILEELVKNSQFEDIPDVLINHEVEKMVAEYKNQIAQHGLNFEEYLLSIKKSANDIRLDFTAKAVERVKASLIIRKLAEQEKIEISDKEVADEIEKELNLYKDSNEAQSQIRRPEYVGYVQGFLTNRKVLDFLREKCVK